MQSAEVTSINFQNFDDALCWSNINDRVIVFLMKSL